MFKIVSQYLHRKTWLLFLIIFSVAFTLRFIAALKLAIRPDEIVYVDWIGKWLSENFWAYFFQFSHKITPPNSPFFANPPLAMGFISTGILLAKKIGISELLGARLVNVLISSLTAVLIFSLGKKMFNFRTGLLASAFFILTPIIIVNNATAYLETLLVFWVVLALWFFWAYFQKQQFRYVIFLVIVMGLAMATKYTVLSIVLVFWIGLFVVSIIKKRFLTGFILPLFIFLTTIFISWAGFRQLSFFSTVFWYYHNQALPYPMNYPVPVYWYYYIMLGGYVAPIIILGIFSTILFIGKNLIKKKFSLKLGFLLLLVIVYLSSISYLAKYGNPHQLMPIFPFIGLLFGYGFDKIFENFNNKFSSWFLGAILIICLSLPLFAWPIRYWGLYSNFLVGGPAKAINLYSLGAGGEGLDEIASYVKKNTDEKTKIGIVGYDNMLAKYVSNPIVPVFLNEGSEQIKAKEAKYLIVPQVYTADQSNKMTIEFSKIEPIYSFGKNGLTLFKVYKIQ